MDLFADFDAAYGGYYEGMPSGDGTIDVIHGGAVVDNLGGNDFNAVDNVVGSEPAP